MTRRRLLIAAAVVAVLVLIYESVMGALDVIEEEPHGAFETGPGWRR